MPHSMLADKLGGNAHFVFTLLLRVATWFSGSDVKASKRLIQAGQTAVLNTDLRFLAAEQTENLQRELIST